MIKPKILVTSAAGRTSTETILQLLKLGFPVRAMVRRIDVRSEKLRKAGAEIIVGDQLVFEDLRQAMKGVARAYHCPPFTPNLLENLMLFALAAEEAKLEVVALMSGWNTIAQHKSIHSRSHWIANHIYRLMPNIDVIHINPGLFAFTYFLGLPAIVNLGMFMAPLGNGYTAPPSNEDIGRVAAYAIADPKDHIDQSYHPTGPELLGPNDIANIFTTVLGRKVTYKDVPFKTFTKAAQALGFSKFEISQVNHFTEELRQGAFAVGGVTDHVERVTGSKPEPFKETARRYFNNPALIDPRLQTGTKISSLIFVAKMMFTKSFNAQEWENERDHPATKSHHLAHQNDEWVKSADTHQLNILPFLNQK
ncbi:NmrA family NAD(P)-binding protein [Paremcibacter congregatus]|uniref:NmrA-like domain-containing protein n=1 Tax=Paremcibacter congregatus TaxID=2043170 RepID=A0A2G4YNK6_9PROT|nr:NmrA family NAD(P)-binding protein [Paremcibacter congregatus]PHZ83890.1 hypothetical protein CRD36_16200 [Paremcibacter congregatus]QDE27594.1 hypothetical protein FIV45_10035 [Paremcibacter congregatus]